MRVLTLSNCPLDESQGSGYVILNFARGLRNLGHTVDLFGPEHFDPAPFLGAGRNHRHAVGMLACALRNLMAGSYDIVEFYGGQAWLATDLLSRLSRRNFLIIAHSNGIEPHVDEVMNQELGNSTWDGKERRWYQRLVPFPTKRAFTKADGIITVSHFDRSYAVKEGLQDADRIVCIENRLPIDYLGIDTNFHRDAVIGYCGSWLPIKGNALIKGAIQRILEEFPDCRVKLIGVGPDFKKERWFSSQICGRVEVVPFVKERAELRRIFSGVSILIAPSIYESFGMAVLEGMACGCAIVATRTGFSASLKSGVEALLMEEKTVEALESSLKQLLQNEKQRVEIARAGYQRVQDLSWDSAVLELEGTYSSWLSELKQTRSGSCRKKREARPTF